VIRFEWNRAHPTPGQERRQAADPAAPLDGVRGELGLDGSEQTTVKVVATALPSTAAGDGGAFQDVPMRPEARSSAAFASESRRFSVTVALSKLAFPHAQTS